MNQVFDGWDKVSENIQSLVDRREIVLNDGQKDSLLALSHRLPKNGVIIADEVGMGKTRIAAVLARAVNDAGGRVAILVPPGLGYQWNAELQIAGVSAPTILRSLFQYFKAWEIEAQSSPWFMESTLLISHAFTNWRLGENSAAWRWALLPEIYARWRKQTTGRWPREYFRNSLLGGAKARQAADSIITAISSSQYNHPARKVIEELGEATPWPGALAAAEYRSDAQLRPWLERAVGLGLGIFDLVIVDEAHKSRNKDSILNRILLSVALQSSNARCLAMTATPFELDAEQWTQMLERVQVGDKSKKITPVISNYAQSVNHVRQSLSDESVRDAYIQSASAFKKALDDFLLRRDKRNDPAVIKFQTASGEAYHAYRREQEILVDTTHLSKEWKQVVCAAESLSFVTRQSNHSIAKRLRLTLGNGHGIAAMIDQLLGDKKNYVEADDACSASHEDTHTTDIAAEKRLQRLAWWQEVMAHPFEDKTRSPLYDHPAILAVVKEIEAVCSQGEKVLVFGRFTRPLQALVELLNAREMLRCIDNNQLWPQSKYHEKDDWSAVLAAHKQLRRPGKLSREHIDSALQKQYAELEKQRLNTRKNLVGQIEEGLKNHQPCKRVNALFEAFRNDVANESKQTEINDKHALVVVARAVHELIHPNAASATSFDIAQAFVELIAAASDRDRGESGTNGELHDDEATDLWADLIARLHEEYNRPEGSYARLMYGKTEPATRRLLQLAFNRKHSHPKVLVAQSIVGREGLNFHKACRTVVLLHPEWNPGVVEQQIGRVDRIGSLWEEKLGQAIANDIAGYDLPRIEIRPVIFRGTYDEKNWQVLRDRWDDLRAHLHGIVIPPRIASKYPDAAEIIEEINKAAPDFTP